MEASTKSLLIFKPIVDYLEDLASNQVIMLYGPKILPDHLKLTELMRMGPLNIDMSEFKETSRKLDLLQTWTNSLAYLKNIDEKYILTLYRPAIAKASLIGLSKECKDILLTLKMLALEDQQV